MSQRVLLFGPNGQLGSALHVLLQERGHEVVACSRDALDLSDTGAIAGYVVEQKPDWVINCAAYTQVDKAESEVVRARAINCDAAAAMTAGAVHACARFIHVSTDFVFDGAGDQPYTETDTPNPLGVYGQTKLDGERAVLEANPDAIIVRTSWVYSNSGSNFVKTMLRLAASHAEMRVVDDQVGCPSRAEDIAEALLGFIDRPAKGIFHYCNRGETSWHQFASSVIELAREQGVELQVEKIHAIPTSEYPTPAVRPSYSVLDCSKIKEALSLEIPQWRESLEKMIIRECSTQ